MNKNDYAGDMPSLHPSLDAKFHQMLQEILDTYKYTKGVAGSHAEIIALNDALKASLSLV